MSYNRFFIFLIAALTAFSIYGQEVFETTIAPIEPLKSDWETWKSKRNSTGGGVVRIGLVSNISKDVTNPSFFYTLLPDSKYSILKVIIKSFDGKYNAEELIYNVEGLSSGIHQLKLPTKYRKNLKRYKTDELSILTMLYENISDLECKHYLVSGWDSNLLKTDFVLNVNSRTPVQIAELKNGRIVKRLSCWPIYKFKKNPFYFNYKCVIPKDMVAPGKILVLRKNKGKISSDTKNFPLPIRLQ